MMDLGRVHRPAVRRTAGGLFLVAALSLGLGWLAYDVSLGMRNGRDSDLHRRWVVSQYVREGVNPYPLALAALQNTYGPLGGGRAKPRIYAVPRLAPDDPAAGEAARPLLAAHRTPEAVYPPSADLLLAVTPGMLSEGAVHLAGMITNLTLLLVCALLLRRLPSGAAAYSPLGIAAAAVLLLAWSPTHSAVAAGQFSILVTMCLLLAFRCLDRHEYLAGAWFALALIKPSMALPFLILPFVRGRWRVIVVAAGLHLAATGVQALRFGVAPWELLRQWTGVAAYFTQGQFTLQEVVSFLRLADTPAGFAVIGGFVLFAAAWCLGNRTAADDSLIDFLCFVSILWTYHGPYDFVILLVPLARRLLPTAGPARPGWWLTAVPAVVLLVCVSVASSPWVYGDEVHLAARLVRHAARLLLAIGFAALAVDVWWSARRAAEPERRGTVTLRPV
jgi:hypothetical protein